MPEYTVGTVSDFPEGEGRAVEAGGLDVAVFNLDGDLYAIHNNCPHKNLPLADAGQRRIVEGPDPATETRGDVDETACAIKCPWHRLEWDLTDGHNDLLDYEIPTYEVVVDGGDVKVRR